MTNEKWTPEVEMVAPDKWAAMVYNNDYTDRKWVTMDGRRPQYFQTKEKAMAAARQLAASMSDEPLLIVPTREEVENLQVGDYAIDALGRMRRVASIAYRGTDINGRVYVGYTTEFGEDGSTMTNSMKEGQLVRTVAASVRYTSAELDAIERRINKERTAA